jgi:hypothetical protein
MLKDALEDLLMCHSDDGVAERRLYTPLDWR